ncbi:MAG: CPBP family intramembrane glutamic endopeptidase [Planctomycetota bacterium]
MEPSDPGPYSTWDDPALSDSPRLPDRVPWSVGDGLAVMVAFVGSIMGFAILAKALVPSPKGAPAVLGTAGASVLTLALAYTIVRDRAPRDSTIFSALCAERPPLLSTILRTMPLLVVGAGTYLAVGWGQATILRKLGMSPEAVPQQQAVKIIGQSSSTVVWASMIGFAVLVAPVVEETVFRGVLYLPIRSRLGPVAAGLIVSIIFAAIHHYVWGFPQLLVIGLILTAVFEATGTLLVPVAVHALYNVAIMCVLWMHGGMG